MAIFGQNPKKQASAQNSGSENKEKTAENSNIAAAEYSYFHIHQIKAWVGWTVSQEEVDYTVDPPLHLQ